MLQIRGLIFELNEAQQKLSQREAEVAALRSELETAHAALARVVKRS
jgi:outer membrane protein TolC